MRLRALLLPAVPPPPGVVHAEPIPYLLVLDEVDPGVVHRLAAAHEASTRFPGCRGLLCFRDTVEIPE
jgi:hypothetical protein